MTALACIGGPLFVAICMAWALIDNHRRNLRPNGPWLKDDKPRDPEGP